MKNRELFVLDPIENKIENEGVVDINTNKEDPSGQKIIEYELKTFVCEGEYEKGIYRILDTYLKNVDSPVQPAVWVSGFFGSGKSHLVKMLGYFWEDFTLPSGETARKIKKLPVEVSDKLVELDRIQNRIGRLAVSGTLKDFPSTDIRYSFFQLFLNALGLPSLYHHFRFIHWLKQEGIYKGLKDYIEAAGKNFKKEYQNLFVSPYISKGILHLKPEFAESEAKVRDYLRVNFTKVDTISREQLISTIKEDVLPMFFDQTPCTLIVLDEVQQYIGSDGDKSIDVQNLAQDISKGFEGKFLLVGTGQNALSDTPSLQRLQDRFTVKVMLSDQDVETVTRKTVLEKKPSAVSSIKTITEKASGEIARNLQHSAFAYSSRDETNLVADYPILPSTRKFWKKVLQVIDTAGTHGQLRSQLRIVDEGIKSVASHNMGTTVSADFIFEQKKEQLLQNARLLNDTNNLIVRKKSGNAAEVLQGRVLSVAFLLDQLPPDLPGGRPKSDKQTLADLLIGGISQSSDDFRRQVSEAIDTLVDSSLLMPIGDEFKLQTKAGQEWEQEYSANNQKLINQGDDKIQHERSQRIFNLINDMVKGIRLTHGKGAVPRDIQIHSGNERPSTENKINLWIRDGWMENRKLVMEEIREEGTEAPLSYIYIKKHKDHDLRSEVIKYLAAKETLDRKGMPSDPESQQARKSMETRMRKAEEEIQTLSESILAESDIYLAGGTPVKEENQKVSIEKALNQLLDRQFPEFHKGDHKDWPRALRAAQNKNPTPLEAIGFDKDLNDHPVPTAMLRFMGGSSFPGRDIRSNFTKAPYGWSQDAVDAVIIALVNAEYLSCKEQGLTRGKIGVTTFKKETHTLSAGEKIKLRKLYSTCRIQCKPGEEFPHSTTLIRKLVALADEIGGEAPKPEPISVQFLKEIEFQDGNARLLRILEEGATIKEKFKDWTGKAEKVEQRWPQWQMLERLQGYGSGDEMEELSEQMEAIRRDRLLFQDPDPVAPLLQTITGLLKSKLNQAKESYISIYDERMEQLQSSDYFKQLTPEKKHPILRNHQLLEKPKILDYDARELMNSLSKTSLESWQTRIAALPGQFDSALADAVKVLEPKAQDYSLPRKTLSSPDEIDAYVEDIRSKLKDMLENAKSIILK